MPGTLGRRGATVLGLLLAALVSTRADDEGSEDGRLGMTEAIPCASIQGYEQYVPLDEPAVTRHDKLLIYYRPLHYATERVGEEYRVHLTQDVCIRRRGRKEVLWSKERLLNYEPKTKQPPSRICLTNTIALKGLGVGEYDLDIVLHDQIGKGATASQTLRFRIKPVGLGKDKDGGDSR